MPSISQRVMIPAEEYQALVAKVLMEFQWLEESLKQYLRQTEFLIQHRVGRTSVFGRVTWSRVRKEQMPATIAAESFKAEQGFVADLGPKLARSLEAALILAAS